MSNKELNIPYDELAAHFAGNASAEQQQQVNAWLSENPNNQSVYDELFTVWQDTGIVEPAPELNIDIDAVWSKFETRIDEEETPVVPLTKYDSTKNRKGWLARIAAILIIALGSYFVLELINNDPQETPEIAQLEVMANDEIVDHELVDGTNVRLKQNSTLIYPESFAGNTREVELKGEAFFDVAHNPDKPFIIHADDASIKVLGTSFTVSALSDSDSVSVYVETGKVLLYSGNEQVELTPGMKGVFVKSTGEVLLVQADPNEDFWRDQMLYFQKVPLEQAIQTINRSYGVKLKLDDATAGKCEWDIIIDQLTIVEVIELIEVTFEMRAGLNGDEIIFYGKGC